MAIKTFKRKELKYFVTAAQYEIIVNGITQHMKPDKFCKNGGSYMIYNIYFDTEDDSIIRHSISKPYFKEKLRMRSYRMPISGDEKVYLELKRKIGGVVAKRRAVMSYNEAVEFTTNGIAPETDNYQDKQVIAEISDFLERNEVSARVYISYERVAYFGKEDSDFRISFDRNILTRRQHVNLTTGEYGNSLLGDGRYLMEVKCAGSMPMWMCSVLSALEIRRVSFSKYGTEYKRYLQLARQLRVS